MKQTLLDCLHTAGQILLDHFGGEIHVRAKENQSSVVTDADLASERCVVARIREQFPDHSILTEETGYDRRDSEYTWIIDPLDGTSNYVAGLPWWGVQIAVLQKASPIQAGMFLPKLGLHYFSERGQGVECNGSPVRLTSEASLQNTLVAFGLDASEAITERTRQADLLSRVAAQVRNIRATNCLLDFGYTLEGYFGGVINLNTKIWDIAPVSLMLPEAGGLFTQINGQPIRFRLDTEPFDRSYGVLGASQALHPQLVAAVG